MITERGRDKTGTSPQIVMVQKLDRRAEAPRADEVMSHAAGSRPGANEIQSALGVVGALGEVGAVIRSSR
jgi:hypothetical protein